MDTGEWMRQQENDLWREIVESFENGDFKMSNRKPFNVNAGYVASRKNPLTNSSNVIYKAAEAGIDASQKYVTVCEAHHQMVSSSSIPNARIDMKYAGQWCSDCRFIVENTAGLSGFPDVDQYLLNHGLIVKR